MDLDYLELVLKDFTLKQLYIINWLNNQLEKNIEGRHSKIWDVLREYCGAVLNGWTPLKVEQALMAVSELGFLNRNNETELNKCLKTHLTKVKTANISIEPYVKTCCGIQLKIKPGRDITVFGMNKSYLSTTMNGDCSICHKRYAHNFFISGKERFVTYESVCGSQIIYFGGDYGYEKSFIKWLTNSIMYLYSGFENFAKCYNATKDSCCHEIDDNGAILSPTRIQDLWFLYNYIISSFFYMEISILKIPFSW